MQSTEEIWDHLKITLNSAAEEVLWLHEEPSVEEGDEGRRGREGEA